MRHRIVTAFFCLLLACASVLIWIVPDRYYSERERRRLTQRESVRLSAFFSGGFQTALADYLSDQFPGRDGWVTLRTLADLAAGKRESGGVWFAKGGYLIPQFDGGDSARFEANLAALGRLAEASEAADLPLTVVPVPTAAAILSDRLPPFAPHADEAALIARMAQDLPVLDITSTLEAHRDEAIYYRTDHHLTSLGAYYSYAAYCAHRGRPVPPVSRYRQEVLTNHFFGTSYAKVQVPFVKPDTITAFYRHAAHRVDYNDGNDVTDSLYRRDRLDSADPYAVFLNGNQAQTVIDGAGSEGRLLMIKDSYGNAFAQFPAEDYEAVHLLDPRFFRGDVMRYAREHDITEIVVLCGVSFLTEEALRLSSD